MSETQELYHIEMTSGVVVDGAHDRLSNTSGIYGDCSGIHGDASNIKGDVTGITGDASLLFGDIADVDLTDEERQNGVSIDQILNIDFGGLTHLQMTII